mmetsp:Transcript_34935/g.96527  ORF Transcript_34935/g.96527 Transcript_34935/m.96527 type:complete len:317 (-) Transcript_34935:844-1794(-)
MLPPGVYVLGVHDYPLPRRVDSAQLDGHGTKSAGGPSYLDGFFVVRLLAALLLDGRHRRHRLLRFPAPLLFFERPVILAAEIRTNDTDGHRENYDAIQNGQCADQFANWRRRRNVPITDRRDRHDHVPEGVHDACKRGLLQSVRIQRPVMSKVRATVGDRVGETQERLVPLGVPIALLSEPNERAEQATSQTDEEEHQGQRGEGLVDDAREQSEQLVILPELEDAEDAGQPEDAEHDQRTAARPVALQLLQPEGQDCPQVDEARDAENVPDRRHKLAIQSVASEGLGLLQLLPDALRHASADGVLQLGLTGLLACE